MLSSVVGVSSDSRQPQCMCKALGFHVLRGPRIKRPDGCRFETIPQIGTSSSRIKDDGLTAFEVAKVKCQALASSYAVSFAGHVWK